MADISKIKLPDGSTYNIKDTVARDEIKNIEERISSGMNYLGITTTTITDGSIIETVLIDDNQITAKAGDFVIYGDLEFVFNGTKWQELGDPTGKGLGDLAYKDNASVEYIPTGTISQPTFSGTTTTLTSTITPEGNISKPTFTGTQETISSSYTPVGTVSISAGSTGTTNYTPAGVVSAPDVTITPTTVNVNSITNVGTLPSCTLPSLEATVDSETLSLDWTEGAFDAGTLPTKGANTTVVKSVTADATAPTFTGTGTVLSASFTGEAGIAEATYTPTGSVSQPTFTGIEADVSIDYTPTGTVSKPTFTGTETTITVS